MTDSPKRIDDFGAGQIMWRLNEITKDLDNMSGMFVRQDIYESQRTDAGRRIGEIEKDVVNLQADLKQAARESDRRYRTTVNLAFGAFLSFVGGLILLAIQLVLK